MSTDKLLVDMNCVGRTTFDHRCFRPVVEVIATMPMCSEHRAAVHTEVLRRPETADHTAVRTEQVRRSAPQSVVYYLGDPDSQLVKIGTSTKLKARLAVIRMPRPKVLLLATEPGTYTTENTRHRQFRSHQAPLPGEREWFRKTPLLMEHIARLRSTHGILCPGSPVPGSWIAPVRRHLRAAS